MGVDVVVASRRLGSKGAGGLNLSATAEEPTYRSARSGPDLDHRV